MTTEVKREAIELWFFRDLLDEQRLNLIALALGSDIAKEATTQSHQRRCLRAIMPLVEPQVSDDTVRVPREPTEAMLQEGWDNSPVDWCDQPNNYVSGKEALAFIWRAMLTAAPASEPQALSEERAREVLDDTDEVPWDREDGCPEVVTVDTAIRAMIRFATETQKGSGE